MWAKYERLTTSRRDGTRAVHQRSQGEAVRVIVDQTDMSRDESNYKPRKAGTRTKGPMNEQEPDRILFVDY